MLCLAVAGLSLGLFSITGSPSEETTQHISAAPLCLLIIRCMCTDSVFLAFALLVCVLSSDANHGRSGSDVSDPCHAAPFSTLHLCTHRQCDGGRCEQVLPERDESLYEQATFHSDARPGDHPCLSVLETSRARTSTIDLEFVQFEEADGITSYLRAVCQIFESVGHAA
jgi:hypothetical protein